MRNGKRELIKKRANKRKTEPKEEPRSRGPREPLQGEGTIRGARTHARAAKRKNPSATFNCHPGRQRALLILHMSFSSFLKSLSPFSFYPSSSTWLPHSGEHLAVVFKRSDSTSKSHKRKKFVVDEKRVTFGGRVCVCVWFSLFSFVFCFWVFR